MTGTYTVKANCGYPHEIVRYRIPIRFVRPDRRQSLQYGQIATGTVEQRGAHDIYTFTGAAGDVIKIAGTGCDDGSMVISVFNPDGHEFEGLTCRADDFVKLPQAGTYQMVINSMDGGPARYHFVFQGGRAQ